MPVQRSRFCPRPVFALPHPSAGGHRCLPGQLRPCGRHLSMLPEHDLLQPDQLPSFARECVLCGELVARWWDHSRVYVLHFFSHHPSSHGTGASSRPASAPYTDSATRHPASSVRIGPHVHLPLRISRCQSGRQADSGGHGLQHIHTLPHTLPSLLRNCVPLGRHQRPHWL